MRWKAVTTVLAAAAMSLGLTVAAGAAPPSPPATETPNHEVMLGDFASPVWLPMGDDGVKHVDIDATLDALEEANANSYAYVIFGLPHYGDGNTGPDVITAAQWADFPAFAEAAGDRGIDVHLYITPPSSSALDTSVPRPEQVSGLEPFGWDYIAWAEAIAELSVEFPNIGGMMIDDFNANTVEENSPWPFAFTRDYVQQMSQAAKAINPDFQLFGVVYYEDYTTASVYRGALDGIIFPYMAATGQRGTGDPSQARAEGEVIGDLTHCASGGWCTEFLGAGAPAGAQGSATASGAVTDGGSHELSFSMNTDGYWPDCADSVGCLEFSVPPHTATTAGEYAAFTQTVTVEPMDAYELSFWVSDGFRRDIVDGYHLLHVLIDGEVVFTRDVAGSQEGAMVTVDVTDQVAGKSSVDIEVRMEEARGVGNFGQQMWVDSISLTGAQVADGDFADRMSGAWLPSTFGENVSGYYTGGHYQLEAVVNDQVVLSEPVYGYQGWHDRSLDVTSVVGTSSDVAVEVRMVALDDDAPHQAVWIDDVTISGTELAAETFDDPEVWSTDAGEGFVAESVPDFNAVWMTYAGRHSLDPPGHQPSPDYIADVLETGLQLIREDLMDGSLIYVLNLTDPVSEAAGAERARVGDVYGDFAATELAGCDTVLTGDQEAVEVMSARTCLVDARVIEGVQVSGGELLLIDSEVRGGVLLEAGSLTMCGTTVRGAVEAYSATEIRLGASMAFCTGSDLSGGVSITGTSGEFVIADLTVAGSLTCSENATAPETRSQPSRISGSADGQCVDL